MENQSNFITSLTCVINGYLFKDGDIDLVPETLDYLAKTYREAIKREKN